MFRMLRSLFVMAVVCGIAATAVAGPILNVPADFTVEATSGAGAIVRYVVTSSGQPQGEDEVGRPINAICSPPSGSLFPMGATTVSCLATDLSGTTTRTFRVTVRDAESPLLTLPAPISVSTTSSIGEVVTFITTAEDAINGVVPVTCTPPSGSVFEIGITFVRCSASDASGNTASSSFTVTVAGSATPSLNLLDITTEAAGPSGAEVSFEGLSDGTDFTFVCSAASGSLFPVGVTTVNCTATNGSQTLTGSFDVNVVDTTPPVLTLPGDLVVNATGPGTVVTFTATAVDVVDTSVAVTCAPPSGSAFAVGTTTVQCSAVDDSGNTATDGFSIEVRDVTPPVIVSVTVSPDTLWPPNHQMVPVTVTVHATDEVDPAPFSRIYFVSANEPVQGPGSGSTSPDWLIIGDLGASLRAERSGSGSGRVYTLYIECFDDAGNRSTVTVQVTVPRDQGRRRA